MRKIKELMKLNLVLFLFFFCFFLKEGSTKDSIPLTSKQTDKWTNNPRNNTLLDGGKLGHYNFSLFPLLDSS